MADSENETFALWDEQATALGTLCLMWAVVDKRLEQCLHQLLNIPKSKVASITTSMNDVSSRCDVLKRLVYIEAPSLDWREEFCTLVTHVSGYLAETRNRFVHDIWEIANGAMTRTDKRVQLKKPQSFQPKVLTHGLKIITPPRDVLKLVAEVTVASECLKEAAIDLVYWRAGEPLPAPSRLSVSLNRQPYQGSNRLAIQREP